jgi:hypothetical protein
MAAYRGRSTSSLDAVTPFPADHELIGFFEVEPILADQNVPWCYNTLTFVTIRGSDKVACEICPGYGTIRLLWERDGNPIGRFELAAVSGLHLTSKDGAEFVAATFSLAKVSEFKLHLKPHVQVEWGTQD